MNCRIVQDLLPLYHDGVCSDESRAAVEAHLAGCEDCRRMLADMDAPLPAAEGKKTENAAAAVKKIAGEWRRRKWRAWLRGAAAAALACALAAGLWVLATQWTVFPVDPAKIQVTDLRQLSDGRILYHFRIDDDRTLHTVRWEFGEDGDVWLLPKRALYTEKRDEYLSMADFDQVLSIPELNAWAQGNGVDTETVRIWYGQGEDRVLLWEEGMELPAANQRDEETYGFNAESAAYWSTRRS